MKKLHIYILFMFFIITTSCVKEITPDFEFEEQIFISGILTSEEDFVLVQIQKTVAVNDSTFNAVNDAQVSLFTREASSNAVSLVSDSFIIDNGNYTTSEIITPIIGNTYWIEVVLEDETIYTSEEEVLKTPIPIIDMVKTDDIVEITFTDQIEEQNFYLINIEILNDGVVTEEELLVFNDTVVTENLEESLSIAPVDDRDTVRVNAFNINFNTFQFYNNIISEDNSDLELLSLFLTTNVVGNITNVTKNKLALGNFGVAGFSTRTMDF